MKNAKKNKHLSFEDRCVIEEFLNHGYNFTQIANRISKYRTTIARDVRNHRYLRTTNSCNNQPCCFESKPPYAMVVLNLLVVKKLDILILTILLIMNINKILLILVLI